MKFISQNVVKFNQPASSILFTQKCLAKPHKSQCIQLAYNSTYNSAYLKYKTSVFLMTAQILYKKISNAINGKKPNIAKEFPKDTVILHQFPRAFNTPSLSPFAMKLETWCRAADIPYQNQFGMQRGKNGLIPFIKLNDYVVEDSQRCIEYLSEIFEKDLNSHLTEEQKAVSRLVIKLTDDSLKWSMAMFRFVWNENGMKDNMLPRFAYWNFSYRVHKAAKFAGYGMLSKDELFLNAKKDLDAMSQLVGEKKFLFSDEKPCEADLALFGLVSQLLWNDTGIVHKYLKADCQNLVRHCENLKELYWKDWDSQIRSAKRKL